MVAVRRAAVAVRLMLLLAACPMAAADLEDAMAADTAGLSMQAVADLKGNALVIRYRIYDGSGRDVYLTNLLVRAGAEKVVDVNHVYARLNDDTLIISKTMPPVPASASPTTLVAPFTTVLRNGASFSETVTLELPLLPYLEYADNTPVTDDDGKPLAITVRKLVFAVGYFVRPQGAADWTDQQFDHEVTFFRNPPGVQAAYGELAVPLAVQGAIPVLRTRAMEQM